MVFTWTKTSFPPFVTFYFPDSCQASTVLPPFAPPPALTALLLHLKCPLTSAQTEAEFSLDYFSYCNSISRMKTSSYHLSQCPASFVFDNGYVDPMSLCASEAFSFMSRQTIKTKGNTAFESNISKHHRQIGPNLQWLVCHPANYQLQAGQPL